MYELTLRQRFWAIRVAGMLCAALSLQSCASADDETAKGIAAAKAKQLEAARQQARAPFSAGEIATREVRPTTLRDSGQPDAIGYLRHVDFRSDGGVGFLVDQLALRLVPRRPGDPVSLDDNTLTMHAEMRRRGAWVPIELRGPVTLRDAQTLVFHPNDVKVRGQDAGALLDAAHIELANLLPVSTPPAQ
ncbi:hypothetical protein V4890_20975 [Ralstonia solanacearum species complex bacterium KE056]|uniref:hypothetical protein n=1 Tax=Ralstonia solanacearum species complex bacterium KE056 TaxID=3119585 RepID=UPI002FC2C3A4